ncbi:MAG: AMP-binding protein [Polyangiales bacterium]
MNALSIVDAAAEQPNALALIESGKHFSYEDIANEAKQLIRKGHPESLDIVEPDLNRESFVRIAALLQERRPFALLHPRWTETQKRDAIMRLRAEPEPNTTTIHEGDVVVFTSGSEAEPKAVVLSQAALEAAATAHFQNLPCATNERWLLSLPPAHIGGLSILTRMIFSRGAVVLAESSKFNADEMLRTIERDNVTTLSVVPTTLHRLVETGNRAPDSLRAVLVGGAPLLTTLQERAIALGYPVVTTYGCTELASQICTQSLFEVGAAHVGRALNGIDIRIQHGEIQARGRSIMRGYLGRTVDSAFTADGWYATGDLAQVEETGVVVVRGRVGDMIISGGENVSPARVEAVAMNVQGVQQAVAFGIEDSQWGQTVALAIAAAADFDVGPLKVAIQHELAPYERPKVWARFSEMPLNSNGKLDRRRIIREAMDGFGANAVDRKSCPTKFKPPTSSSCMPTFGAFQ